MHTTLRFHGDLAALARTLRDAATSVTTVAPRSVKDLIESFGVPHTEVAHVTVDGGPVGFGHRIVGGEHVVVYPPAALPEAVPADAASVLPPDPPRAFACDMHLGTLARRLRLLGFDTWYGNDATDATLVEVATNGTGRVLLTRDRGLLSRRVVVHGFLPRSDDPDRQLLEVVRRFGLVRAAAPLSRCVRCNDLLEPVTIEQVGDEVPPRSRRAFDRFARCRGCRQVYWPGSHLDALGHVLAITRAGPDGAGGVASA
jgi:uncharacterized protein